VAGARAPADRAVRDVAVPADVVARDVDLAADQVLEPLDRDRRVATERVHVSAPAAMAGGDARGGTRENGRRGRHRGSADRHRSRATEKLTPGQLCHGRSSRFSTPYAGSARVGCPGISGTGATPALARSSEPGSVPAS